MHYFSKVKNRILKIISLLFAINLVLAISWLTYVNNHFTQKAAPFADATIILMGNFNSTYTALGNKTLRRLNHALQLYKQGFTATFLCVGGSRPDKGVYGAELMKQYLISQGVATSAILIEKNSFDTQTNWKNAKQVIANQKWKSVQVISTALHLYRLKGIIEQYPSPLNITYLPISLSQPNPAASYFELWFNVHYDWAAHLSYLLPQATYSWLIKVIRSQN
ncbi:YdcF family protein [Endozoicomonas sp. SM1973]|uniref:YdcF family protein n=1 Tax=Spartinivicinus marinus TaxID=2994442 RepID=A0A853IN85_9GAMM|nr:YdcF family protein [Spartinivicinus marinus]MCX4028065.1 YdcF family protein [Spartinivicinus marinus]NYZ69286.1 YdcF family protein [Spartinivicinus marinus]